MKLAFCAGLVLLGVVACGHEGEAPPAEHAESQPAGKAGDENSTGLTDEAQGVLSNVGNEVDKATNKNLNVGKDQPKPADSAAPAAPAPTK